jgi:WD40 repeat protein
MPTHGGTAGYAASREGRRGGVSVFEVAVGPGGGPGRLRVEVVSSAAGEAGAEVSLDAEGLHAGRRELERTLLASAVSTRQVLSLAEQEVRETGQALFTAALGTGAVAGRYEASAALAAQRDEPLQIVLRIDAPELAGLPWEAMYDPGAGGYVCRLHELVRYVPVAAVPPPLRVRLPLRVLGVISAPRGLAPLDTGREREQLERALSRLTGQRLAEISWAEPTWAGLHEKLLDGPWHVLHFIGHGDFDPGRDEGVLALTAGDGRADLVGSSRLADLLRQARPMPRLVVLNSCSGGAGSSGDLFSGTAAALARGGISAVAAMQYAISDPAAVAFARGFYAALARGRNVDQAVSAGRIAILGTGEDTLEWITPVLYVRGRDTRLFDIPAPAPADADAPPEPAAEPTGPEVPAGKPASRPEPYRTVPRPRPAGATAVRGPGPSSQVRSLNGHPTWVHGVAFSPDGTRLATISDDGRARLWDVSTGSAIWVTDPPSPSRVRGFFSSAFGVAFSPDGTLVATASAERPARLWDATTGAAVRTLSGHTNRVRWVAFSPDGTLVATASTDKTARLWDARTGAVVRTLAGHANGLWGVAFSPDGTLVATTSADHTARLWDTATGDTVRTLSGQGGTVRRVAFSPDGTLLATTSSNATVRLWHADTGAQARTLAEQAAWGVAFSPDGTLLATSGGGDHKIVLWEVATGTVVRVLSGHSNSVVDVAFSPDGTLLASASGDKTARLWA